jgi:uncharacterized protein
VLYFTYLSKNLALKPPALYLPFAKTKSLYLPIGLHFGWNIVNTVVFLQGPLGSQLLINNGGQKLGIILSLVVLLFQILAVPFITYWY